MTDVIVECKGGVVQEITVVGDETRVFVLDWDEEAEGVSGAECAVWPAQTGVESLAPETRERYERVLLSDKPSARVL